ncbi:MAG: NAD(P)/FAD-dependent oxidoreductase [Thermoleophilaceae bacterium]|nr:NAD(P)/FAD-dependent oxidoreductase [Thermoleophilaceae bacterium]
MQGSSQRKVTIVGAGVAGLEALLALRKLAPGAAQVELIADSPQFVYSPLAVAEPFGLGTAHKFELTRIAREQGARLHVTGVARLEPGERRIITWDGRALGYDILLFAIGARAVNAIPGTITVKGPAYTSRFRTLLRELDRHRTHRIAFAVPVGSSWPLPLYELALMTAAHIAERGLRKTTLQLVTHESEPLELFGPKASAAVRELLDERGVELITSRAPVEAHKGELITAPGGALAADRVVSLPRLVGPSVQGLPGDGDGFIPVDLHARVEGLEHVYAAGDATTNPIKQGGVAAQQADAAAEAIAAELGVIEAPHPFRPVLRGLLLTGGTPRYFRSEVAGGRGDDLEVSESALWWPPGKIAGRHLAPYLAAHIDEGDKPLEGIGVEVQLDGGAAAVAPSR